MPDGHSPERRPPASPLAMTHGPAPALVHRTATVTGIRRDLTVAGAPRIGLLS